MDGPTREHVSSFSDDDDDDLSPLRASFPSPRSDEDEFSHRRPSQSGISRNFPPRISTEDDGSRAAEEAQARNGSCSPLVSSFAALTTQGSFAFSPRSCLGASRASEITPLRRPQSNNASFSYESQDFSFTESGLTSTSQVRTLHRQESKGSRSGAETPARKSTTPKNARKPLSAVPSRTSSPSSLFGSSKRTPMNELLNNVASLAVPTANDSPIRYDFRKEKSPKRSLAALPAFAEPKKPSRDSVPVPLEDFMTQPSREVSPPARPPVPRHVNRRLSLGERNADLLPSPIAKSWPGSHSYTPRRNNDFLNMTSPAPCVESKHSLTPNEPKNMVAPGRPRKRGTCMPSNCTRSILSSPMAVPASAIVEDVPELPAEACPMMISNPVADSQRGSKFVRRRSVLESTPTRHRDDSPDTLLRTVSSPQPGANRHPSAAPSLSRRVSAGVAAPPALKQNIEEQRIERGRCRILTEAMSRRGMKMLCLDWDLTVVGIHTQSRWIGTSEQLAQWVRPVFRNLVWAALLSNIRIAFISFSGQTSCIHGAIRKAFGSSGFRDGRFVVRCSDKEWGVEDAVFSGMFPRAQQSDASKLAHICSAASFFTDGDKENSNPQRIDKIQPHNIVMIDDDLDNVMDADKHDVHSIQMDPMIPDKFLEQLEEMCGIMALPPPPVSLHMTDQ